VIEHTVRFDAACSSTSTARRHLAPRAIEDAGGWEHDTLTEDLDLSYRAQLRGWRFVYAPTSASPPSAARARRVQEPAAPLGQGLGAGRAQAARPHPARAIAAAHEARGGRAPDRQHGLSVRAGLALLLPLVARHGTLLPSGGTCRPSSVCTLSVILFYERSQRAIGRTAFQRLVDVRERWRWASACA
jgi:hypothetical protein